MEMAQLVSSMVLSLRKKANIRVRQPLSKIMIPIDSEVRHEQLLKVERLILSEVNVKEIQYLTDDKNVLVKKIKPNFKTLGPRYGKLMKQISQYFSEMSQNDIREFERNNGSMINIDNQEVILNINDAEITTDDIPGWTVTTQDNITVALDMTITKELADEGLAREIVNRIQGMRKDKGLEVTDHIVLTIEKNNDIVNAVEQYTDYICSETLATLNLVDYINDENVTKQELVENIYVKISISKA